MEFILKLGVNVNPEDLTIDITGKIVETINIPETTIMWNSIKIVLIIIVIFSTIIEVALIWFMGWVSIIPAILAILLIVK